MKRKFRTANPASQRLADAIVRKMIMVQTRWADFMQRKTERLSVKGKKLFLILFCILTSTISCCIIITSFTTHSKQNYSVTAIHTPQHITGEQKERPSISNSVYSNIERFKNYMDTCDRHIKDSILRFRPGLMDSVLAIEQIYKHQ